MKLHGLILDDSGPTLAGAESAKAVFKHSSMGLHPWFLAEADELG